jgi:hypothetical protein
MKNTKKSVFSLTALAALAALSALFFIGCETSDTPKDPDPDSHYPPDYITVNADTNNNGKIEASEKENHGFV